VRHDTPTIAKKHHPMYWTPSLRVLFAKHERLSDDLQTQEISYSLPQLANKKDGKNQPHEQYPRAP
jgi:hypothetical protein